MSSHINRLDRGVEKLIMALFLLMGLLFAYLLYLTNMELGSIIALGTSLAIEILLWVIWFRNDISNLSIGSDGMTIYFRRGDARFVRWFEIRKLSMIDESPLKALNPILILAVGGSMKGVRARIKLRDGSRYVITREIAEAIQESHLLLTGSFLK